MVRIPRLLLRHRQGNHQGSHLLRDDNEGKIRLHHLRLRKRFQYLHGQQNKELQMKG